MMIAQDNQKVIMEVMIEMDEPYTTKSEGTSKERQTANIAPTTIAPSKLSLRVNLVVMLATLTLRLESPDQTMLP